MGDESAELLVLTCVCCRVGYQVVSYNRVSKIDNAVTSRNKPNRTKLYVPSVPLFAFHSYTTSGEDLSSTRRAASPKSSQHYLATVDVTRGEEFGPESSLKIWKWDPSSSAGPKFHLVTQADRPHASNRVTSLVFFSMPTSAVEGVVLATTPALATSGADGTVKIWNRC